jgi:spore protease
VPRHLLEEKPNDYARHFRSVCAISPGVLGITGIQTFEILKGLVSRLKPDAVIVIDALASQSLKRLATTFQVSDTGISPGSGVNTRYSTIDKESLGVKVISVGVPTVVDAATLTMDIMGIINKDDKNPNHEELATALQPYDANLLVTPNNIDMLISDTAKIIAFSINKALHKNLSDEDITSLIS